jgi:uncharacterized membrane protein YdjX (TVP38/TMEM64 family)
LLGTIYVIIGATIGATLAFTISRYLAKDFFQKKFFDKFKKLNFYDSKFKKNGFIFVLYFRLIPIFPFNFLNYGLGLTNVKFRDYFLATLFGMLPGTFVYVYFGDSLANFNFINIAISIILILVLSLIVAIYKKNRGLKT